jgi:6-phosphogluconolactonase
VEEFPKDMPQPIKLVYYVLPDAAVLTERAAEYFVESIESAIARRRRARIAISGGKTPRAVFEALADPAQPWRTRIAWDSLDLYWVDERCVAPSDEASNYNMTRQAMLDHVPLTAGQIHRMEGELEPEVAASRYESELRNSFRLEGAESPRFDVIQLGMGSDGHTASLFPRTSAVFEFGRIAVANKTGAEQSWRLTLTAQVINLASNVFFLISGEDKAAVVKEVFLGLRDPERLPSQLIRPVGGILTLLLDKAAASQLPAPAGNGRGELAVG